MDDLKIQTVASRALDRCAAADSTWTWVTVHEQVAAAIPSTPPARGRRRRGRRGQDDHAGRVAIGDAASGGYATRVVTPTEKAADVAARELGVSAESVRRWVVWAGHLTQLIAPADKRCNDATHLGLQSEPDQTASDWYQPVSELVAEVSQIATMKCPLTRCVTSTDTCPRGDIDASPTDSRYQAEPLLGHNTHYERRVNWPVIATVQPLLLPRRRQSYRSRRSGPAGH